MDNLLTNFHAMHIFISQREVQLVLFDYRGYVRNLCTDIPTPFRIR